jgi:hypothetical protein
VIGAVAVPEFVIQSDSLKTLPHCRYAALPGAGLVVLSLASVFHGVLGLVPLFESFPELDT